MKLSDKVFKSGVYGKMKLATVGIVRSPLKEPSLVAESGDLEWRAEVVKVGRSRDVTSEIVISDVFTGILEGLEEFSHILVLYWAHRVTPEGRKLVKAHPMGRKDLPLVGVFSTCSPARPNPILATVVRLLERKGNTLTVEGLDAIDGSPIVDIKPYNPGYYASHDIKIAGWMERIFKDIARGLSQSPDSIVKQ